MPNVSVSFSLPIFIKHLANSNSKPIIWYPNRYNRKTLATTRSVKSSHLETLTSRQKEQISLYVDALLQWNQRMNLTAVTETDEVMKRHVEDSLAIIPPIQNSYISNCSSSFENLNLVDVGTGAGWKVTLLESMQKRCLFLEHAVGLTGLTNVKVLRGRAEFIQRWTIEALGQSVGQNLDFREMFDVAVARAVAEMRILAEYCLPLVRVGGLFVAAKGHDPQAILALHRLAAEQKSVSFTRCSMSPIRAPLHNLVDIV
ncbi:hypothetical protein HHK36_015201 [Tetracentron sinense]|uniref:Uncharacterized protein n=1 Tax=Tetracentron sinense TaxID=13715 RepID=A0A834Z8S8_TETSI|nr:hypothetical protein HHK36_015201 [Tetracentron sinense]